MSVSSSQNTLQQLLSEFKLSHLYETLREKEFDSLDILKECSEDDVSALCKSLNLCLLDKLRFKRALTSVNIPKHSVCYKIVNKEEREYIVNIHKSLQRMQNMITNHSISNEELTKRYKLNGKVIHSSFDLLIAILNQQRDALLKQLKNVYNDGEYRNKQMMIHLNAAKTIKKQCQKLLMKDIHLNNIDARTNVMKNLNVQCSNKEQLIIDIKSKMKDTKCNIQNISIKVRNDDEIQRFIDAFVTISYTEDDILTDTITTDDIELYTHCPVRAWKRNKSINKWIGRGRGTVSLYHNNKQRITKLIFNDEESNSVTLLQYVDNHIRSLKCVQKDSVSWESYDYSIHNKPEKGLWILKFMNDMNAASEFLEIFNDEIEIKTDKNTKNTHKIPYITHSKSAQSVISWNKTIAIPIKTLYCFDNCVSSWKIIASHTQIEFVSCVINHRIKLIAKQRHDGRLVINHYIPIKNANLMLKQELVFQWNVMDDECNITTVSAMFYNDKDAESFKAYFNKLIHCNYYYNGDKTEENSPEIVPFRAVQIGNESKSVPPPINDNNDYKIDGNPPKLSTCKSWDGVETNSSAVVMVKPWSKYVKDNHLEIISDIDMNTDEFDLVLSVEIKSLHRWFMQSQYWKIRTANANVVFYKHKENERMRVFCKVKDEIKLDHWIPSKTIANIKYKNKQFLWSAYDVCAENQGISTFAIKFFNVDDSDAFHHEFLNCLNYNE